MPYNISGYAQSDCTLAIHDLTTRLPLLIENVAAGEYISSKFSKQNIENNTLVIATDSNGRSKSYTNITPVYDNYSSTLYWVHERYKGGYYFAVNPTNINLYASISGVVCLFINLPKAILKPAKYIIVNLTYMLTQDADYVVDLCNQALDGTTDLISCNQGGTTSLFSSIRLATFSVGYTSGTADVKLTVPLTITDFSGECCVAITASSADSNGSDSADVRVNSLKIVGNDDLELFYQNFGSNYGMNGYTVDYSTTCDNYGAKVYGKINDFKIDNV